jgi:hypothetical protein
LSVEKPIWEHTKINNNNNNNYVDLSLIYQFLHLSFQGKQSAVLVLPAPSRLSYQLRCSILKQLKILFKITQFA